jgi:hypothetical protein
MLLRNWQTFPNSSYTIAAQRDILYWIKSVLTNTNSASNTLPSARVWTVISSSNSTTTSNSDLWTTPSAVVRAAAGSPHSWIVLRNTTLGVYVILDYVHATLSYLCDVIVSTDAPTGGTTGNRPTASNTFSFTGWQFDRPSLTAEARYFSMTADEYGGFWIHHHRANGEQVIVATLGIGRGAQSRSAAYQATIPMLNTAQSSEVTGDLIYGFQHGGNQTGNAHLMTPTGVNTPANIFAGNGGKARALSYTGGALTGSVQCMMPPRATSGAATESVYFGTLNGGGYGLGLMAWPLILFRNDTGTGNVNTFVIPDAFVSPDAMNFTVVAAANGGPYMHVRKPGSGYDATTNPYEGVYCNGIIVPWGSQTVIQSSTNIDNSSWRQFPLPDPGQQTGNRGNNITAARGSRGVGGW